MEGEPNRNAHDGDASRRALLQQKLSDLERSEREAAARFGVERGRAWRTRLVLLGSAVLLAVSAVILLRNTLDSAENLAYVLVLCILAVATVFLMVLSSSGVRAALYRQEMIQREIGDVRRTLESTGSGPPPPTGER